jgi:hypothetical protein
LEADSDLLPPALLGVGIEIDEDALVAWCAPREGRVATLYLSWHPESDLVELAQWLAKQGFSGVAAELASKQQLTRIHNWPD